MAFAGLIGGIAPLKSGKRAPSGGVPGTMPELCRGRVPLQVLFPEYDLSRGKSATQGGVSGLSSEFIRVRGPCNVVLPGLPELPPN